MALRHLVLNEHAQGTRLEERHLEVWAVKELLALLKPLNELLTRDGARSLQVLAFVFARKPARQPARHPSSTSASCAGAQVRARGEWYRLEWFFPIGLFCSDRTPLPEELHARRCTLSSVKTRALPTCDVASALASLLDHQVEDGESEGIGPQQ